MDNLKKLRKQKGLSQTQMAQIFNMSFRGYQNIEYGVSETSYENLIRFANYFGCSVDYLLDHETKDLIYASDLTDQQAKIIKEIKQMTDEDLLILEGVIIRLNQEKQNPWLAKK